MTETAESYHRRMCELDGTEKPHDQTTHAYGAFLLQQAAYPDRTLAELHAMAVGAFEMAQTIKEVRSITANLKRAEEIIANR